MIRDNLANVYDDLERFEEPESLHRQALASRQKTLGPNHPDIVQSLNNLGNLLSEQDRHAEAVRYLQEAVTMAEQVFDPEHPTLAEVRKNLELARRAAAAIDVDYEPREPVTDPIDALNAGQIYRQVKYTHGDPDIVGDVVAEGEYATPRQDHSFLAPDAGLARPDGRGGVEIIGATQWLQSDQRQIAAALSLPKEMVLVVNSGIGGSFGGRFVLSWQIHGALLALHTLRPVKMLYTRRETFLARYHRQPSWSSWRPRSYWRTGRT